MKSNSNQQKHNSKRNTYKNKNKKFGKIAQFATSGGKPKTAFPRKVFTTFRMQDRYNLSATSSAGVFTWRCNSLYDPDYTGTGKQPYMFDQYAAIYNRYRVLNTTVTVDIVNTSTTPISFVLYFDNITSDGSNYPAAAVLPFAQQKFVLSNATSAAHQRISKRMNIASGLGYEANLDDDLSSVVTTNPIQVLFAHFVAQPVDQSTSASFCLVYTLALEAMMYDLRNPGESLFKTIQDKPIVEQSDHEDQEQFMMIKVPRNTVEVNKFKA